MESKTITEGKTKLVIPVDAVRLKAKDDITAGNGAKHDLLAGKAALATRTTCNVFSLMRYFGLPVAFYGQDGPDSFIAPRCRMLPWEVVVRGKAYGSYLKRHPEMGKGDSFLGGGCVLEYYLKTVDKRWRGYTLICDDPLAAFPDDGSVTLYDPAKPDIPGTFFLRLRADEVHEVDGDQGHRGMMGDLALRAFKILHAAWKIMGIELVDMKVEFGIDPDGKLLLADVIDNDSWRLLFDGHHLDKQVYREGSTLDEVLAKYERIALASNQFSQNHMKIEHELHLLASRE